MDSVLVRVSDTGIGIPGLEQSKVFDRFYRGVDTEHSASGAGLGLFVARKIVRAHGGNLELQPDAVAGGTTTFRMRLPVVEETTEEMPQDERKAS